VTRLFLPARCAPPGKVHHLLADALPTGFAVERFGPDGARAVHRDLTCSVIVTRADFDGAEWCHASIARPDRMPSYDDLVDLHRWVFGAGYAYQCFVPPSDHINIHAHALHLWGRADGARVLPDFGWAGSI
jgi:hypothetical protein